MRNLKLVFQYIFIFFALTAILTWTYYDREFDGYQMDSDALVYANIYANIDGTPTTEYGLGHYSNILGSRNPDYLVQNVPIHLPEQGVEQGYSTVFSGIVVSDNDYTRQYLIKGNSLQFESGDIFEIAEVREREIGLEIQVLSDTLLSQEALGEIGNISVLNSEGELQPKSAYTSYVSQVGLQGMIQGKLGAFLGEGRAFVYLQFLCCLAFSMVIVAMAMLLHRKYDLAMAGTFYVVFWLAPWTTAFVKSVYWVEFTWLLPAVAGVFVALNKKNTVLRRAGYALIFLTILLKCLCGYEYITFVMMGTIIAIAVDLLTNLANKNIEEAKQDFICTFISGVCALAGFFTALLSHAKLRGEGNLLAGIKNIYEQDVLRRTFGGNPENFSEMDALAMQASVSDVLDVYFNYPAGIDVIRGIDHRFFIIIILVPAVILVWNIYFQKRNEWKTLFLYVVSFVSSISWYVLGRQHSYVHRHLNYVCWYYYFIPICFYIIVKQIHIYVKGYEHISKKQEEKR